MPDVRMPDGTVIRNVPKGVTKDALLKKLEANGYNVAELLVPPQEENMLEKVPVVGDAAAWLADSPLGIASGAASGVKMLTDLFGAGNAVSETLGDIASGLNDMRSSEARRDAIINQLDMEQAEGQGVWEEVKAAGRGFARSPLDFTANAAGTALPAILAGVLTGGTAPVAALVGTGVSQAVGERKGGIYDATYNAFTEAGLSEDQAREAASEAQSYTGENLDQLALAGVLGGIAARFGFELPAARLIGSRIAGRVAGAKAASGITKGALTEAIPEGLQGAQAKLSDNLALQREGFDVDTFAGVAGQGVSEALAGATLGGAFGARGSNSATPSPATTQPEAAEPVAPNMREVAEQVFTTPEQMAEFETLTAQFRDSYGVPEETAAQLAMGALRPTQPEAGPVAGEGEVSSATEPTVVSPATPAAPAAPATVEPAPIIPPVEAVSPQAQVAEQLAEVGVAPEVAPAPPAEAVTPAPNAIWANADFDQPVTVLPLEPQVGPDGRSYQPVSLNGTPSFVPVDQLRPIESAPAPAPAPAPVPAPVPAPALEPVAPPAFEPAPVPTTDLESVAPPALVGVASVPVVEPAPLLDTTPPTLSLPDAPKKVTPERISTARSMLNTALATPEFEGAEITRKELTAAANKMARTPGLEASAALTDVLGIDAMEAAEAAPTPTPAPASAPAPDMDRRAVFAEANQRYPNDDGAATAFYNGALGAELDATTLSSITEGQMAAYEAGRAAAAAPSPTVAPEAMFERPTEAPAPLEATLPEQTDTPVPVTKVAPGVARGVQESRRGQMGTQRGRPVEGAAQLTEGMKAQQDLTAELQAARDAREITDQEVAETLDLMRAPASERELRAMPVERRNQWLEAIELQRQADQLQQRVNEIPKEVLGRPNPERVDMEATLSGVQRRLDGAQQAIVRDARAVFEAKRSGRKRSVADMRKRLRDKDLDPAERRDIQIALREATVQRAQKGRTAKVDTRTPEQVEAELQGKLTSEVMDWLVDTAPNKAAATIARAVRRMVQTLQRFGVAVDFQIVSDTQGLPKDVVALLDDNAFAVTDFTNGDVTIYVNSADMGPASGLDYETVLHEFTHAALSPLLELSERPGLRGTAVARAGRDLRNVLNAIRDHMDRRAQSGVELTPVEQDFLDGESNTFDNIHELLAWALSNPDVMAYLDTVPYEGKKSIFRRFVEVVREALGLPVNSSSALAEVLSLGNQLLYTRSAEVGKLVAGDPSASLKYSAAQKKAREEAKEKTNKGLFKAQMANDAAGFTSGLDEATAGAKLEAKERAKAFTEAAKSGAVTPALIAITPTSVIRNTITKMRPGLGSIVEGIARLEQEMRGMRGSMERAVRRRVKDAEAFVNKHGQAELSAMMTIARVNRVDVTAYKSRAEALAKDPVMQLHTNKNNARGAKARAKDINTAWDAWEALGKQSGGHDLYKMMRQFYKDMYTALRAAQDEDIRSLGLDKAATEKLIREARGDVDSDAEVEEGDHKGVPENLFPAEYFPFRRFGEHVLLVKTGKRAERERYHFESARERNEFEAKRAKQLGLKRGTDEYNEAFTRIQGLENLRDNMSEEGFLLSKLFSAIDETKSPDGATDADTAKFRKNIKDRLYQTYLMTLPERSLRKQFIHAELVTGQSADALRIFRTSAGQYASQLPKVVYGGKIQTQIEAAYDSIKEGDPAERLKLTQLLNAVVSRTREALDPPQRSMLEQRINEFTFLSLMTSIASAAVQPLTIPFQVLPRMVARYGPMQAVSMLSSYTPVMQMVDTFVDVDPATGQRRLVAPTMANVPFIKNNPLRARLWKELDQKRDLFSQKQVDMLLRNRATPGTTAATPLARAGEKYEKLVVYSGALFSSMDQMTREITGMSFAEMEYNRLRKQGKGHEAAIQGAVDAAVRNTNETIGDYTEVEKLDVFRRGPLRRMMGFLRTYSVQRTAYYFRMLNALYNGAPTQTRVQAFNELSMVLAFTALGAGVGANFGYEVIADIIDTIIPAILGEDEMEEWRRQNPLGADSVDYRLRFQWLPEQFGDDYPTAVRIAQRGALSELTGYDWTTRLSQSDLWIRDSQKGDTTFETVTNFLASNLAPQISQGANILKSIDDFAEGNWSRGFAKLAPAAVRGAITARRFATEGETTKSGMTVRPAEAFTTNELVGQVLGFTPNELAKVRELNRKDQSWMRAMEEERGRLFKEYRDILSDPDTTQEDVQVMVEKVMRYNAKVPLDPRTGRLLSQFLIEPQDIIQSVRGRAQRELKTIEGVTYGEGTREALRGTAQ